MSKWISDIVLQISSKDTTDLQRTGRAGRLGPRSRSNSSSRAGGRGSWRTCEGGRVSSGAGGAEGEGQGVGGPGHSTPPVSGPPAGPARR